MQMAQLLMSCVLPAILLLSGLGGVSGQDYGYEHKQEVNLCDIRPGHEPNGEYLGTPGDDLVVYVNWTNNDPTQTHHCRMRFTTCNSCRLHARANASFHYDSCHSAYGYNDYKGWCVPGCTYVHLYDKDYSSHLSSSFTSSSSLTGEYPPILDFVTESRYLYVIACANRTMDPHVLFRLRIIAEDKTQYFGGRHGEIGQSFSSPFFPAEYVLNSEVYKYVFKAPEYDDFITVSFDDWHLSPFSSVLFDRANIKNKIWGSTSRPWIISDSDQLEMTFETGPYRVTGRSLMGFRATYKFHRKMERDSMPYVQTNCGRLVELQESGQITFNPNSDGKEYYDCIWVIKKHPGYERVMIKVTKYHTQDNTYRSKQPNLLEVHEGLTSLGRQVIFTGPSTSPEDEQDFQDYDSHVGFYVRLKGRYWGKEDFMMSFISYNFDECRDLFWCQNGRCITTDVLCNQIDNCGDYSDEQDSVCGTVPTTEPSGSNTILSPVIIIPIVVAMFIIVIICLLAIFIRRCRRLSCQARQARRQQQQRISTVSGSVSHQQRRHNRRRGERRANGSADQYHLYHDLPPSYEDVLNATPIGYLNLGYMDHPNPTTELIQPPSYDEAMSPTTLGPTLAFPVGEPQDESSDSSLPETVQRSLSSSYSSDDTQRGVADQHQHRQAVSSSSSDSSNDGEGLRGEGVHRRGRRVSDGQRDRQDVRQPEGRQRSTAAGVAKPEDSQGPAPVCPSAVIAHNKVVIPQDKPGDGQDNEDHAPAVIMQSSAAASTAQSLPGPQSEGQPSLVCQVEASPIISPPSASPPASHEGHGAHARYEGEEEGASSARSGAACLPSPAHSAHDSRTQPRCTAMEDEPFAHQREGSSSSREAQGRPSPGRRVPPHVLKARNPSSHMLKHLSRSMNDLDRQSFDGRSHHQHGSMPLREFSHSMHNILEADSGAHHRERHHHPSERHRYHHDQSQTLPTSRGMLNDAGQPEGRNSFFPPDGQARRARSADMADQSHVHPDTLQRDRPLHKAGEGTSPSTTRPKPKPKPRRFQQAGERTRPEPKQRQLSGGPRYPDQAGNRDVPSTDRSQLPEEHRPSRQRNSWGKNVDGLSFPRADQRRAGSSDGCQQLEAGHPHEKKNGNRQTTPGYQEQEDPRRAKTNRPPAPPRPDGASRSSTSRGHDLPKPDTMGSGNNRNGYNFSREPPPSGLSHSQKNSPPYRHADPPPYRPRDPSGPSRPAPLHSPTRHAQPSLPSDHSKADAGSFSPPEQAPRCSPPACFGQVPRSAGPVPRMGAQWLPRSEQHSVGVHSRDPGQGSMAGSSRAEGGDGPMTPHRPASLHVTTPDGSMVVTSPETAGSGASTPYLSLQLGGLDGNDVEDVYV